jgi:lipoprotein-anchoring transpeptidase ErfK/SrfK
VQKFIFASLPLHRIEVRNDDQIIKTILTFSTGRQGHLTPTFENGRLSDRREKMHYSSIYHDSNGNPAAMPYALFFGDGSGCAFHAGDPNVKSHGCIHLVMSDAEWLFDWARHDPVGLTIRGPNPTILLSEAELLEAE